MAVAAHVERYLRRFDDMLERLPPEKRADWTQTQIDSWEERYRQYQQRVDRGEMSVYYADDYVVTIAALDKRLAELRR